MEHSIAWSFPNAVRASNANYINFLRKYYLPNSRCPVINVANFEAGSAALRIRALRGFRIYLSFTMQVQGWYLIATFTVFVLGRVISEGLHLSDVNV